VTPQHLRLVRNLLRALARQDPSFHSNPWDELGMAVGRELAEAVEMGALVFQWRFPLDLKTVAVRGKNAGKVMKMSLAPTLNVYSQLEPWRRERLAEHLDTLILAELPRWHGCRTPPIRRRVVRVTRFSSVEPDEISCDVLGAKMPIDRLVQAGILSGDSRKHVVRDPHWTKASPGKGSMLIEVYRIL
jgi:hypothetical protein